MKRHDLGEDFFLAFNRDKGLPLSQEQATWLSP